MDKKTHFGRAGEFFMMSELLLRGWNVAVPVVDIGDDVFVIDDNDKTTWRVQVKTARGERCSETEYKGSVKLSREQLRAAQPIELVYAFLLRTDARWRFLVIPRARLHAIRRSVVQGADQKPKRGRPPVDDDDASSDGLVIEIRVGAESASAWGESLDEFLDTWPEDLKVIEDGPGARRTEKERSEPISEEGPAPSSRP